jgi:hypothetical protein
VNIIVCCSPFYCRRIRTPESKFCSLYPGGLRQNRCRVLCHPFFATCVFSVEPFIRPVLCRFLTRLNPLKMLRRTAAASKALRMTVRNKSTVDIMKYLTTPPYTLPNNIKVAAPPMVYISGEEMTRYTMELV